jgi:hypothetical protein
VLAKGVAQSLLNGSSFSHQLALNLQRALMLSFASQAASWCASSFEEINRWANSAPGCGEHGRRVRTSVRRAPERRRSREPEVHRGATDPSGRRRALHIRRTYDSRPARFASPQQPPEVRLERRRADRWWAPPTQGRTCAPWPAVPALCNGTIDKQRET